MTDVLERLRDARDAHDLDGFVACFDPRYRSEQPVHPDRAFVGRDQVRTNWAAVLAGVPDFRAELLRSARQGDTGTAPAATGPGRPGGLSCPATRVGLPPCPAVEQRGSRCSFR